MPPDKKKDHHDYIPTPTDFVGPGEPDLAQQVMNLTTLVGRLWDELESADIQGIVRIDPQEWDRIRLEAVTQIEGAGVTKMGNVVTIDPGQGGGAASATGGIVVISGASGDYYAGNVALDFTPPDTFSLGDAVTVVNLSESATHYLANGPYPIAWRVGSYVIIKDQGRFYP